MRINTVHIRNFKRFTDLTIRSIPESARLVLVVGPNGSGKSSLFEAFLSWYKGRVGFGYDSDKRYYQKEQADSFNWDDVRIQLHGDQNPTKGSLYIRSAYRNDADFKVSGLQRQDTPTDNVGLSRVIDNDQTVSKNYQRLVYETMTGVYNSTNDSKTVAALREELIGAVGRSMANVFGDLVLNSISDPLGDGSFFFKKGVVSSYHYKNLSGGEKAAFDLLLDLHIKKKFYTDSIYCIDEIETHLHTRVQGILLKEIVRILPGNSQLWTTTHSLGVIRGAQEIAAIDPASVCIIDFDGVEPDQSHELVPSSLGRVSWEKCLSIALDDLSEQIAPKTVVVCEGSSVGNRRKDFDAEIYNRILGPHLPEVVFISGGASSELEKSHAQASTLLEKLLPNTRVLRLRDRDDLSEQQVQELNQHGVMVLARRNVESYLFDDDVIAALVARNSNASAAVNEAIKGAKQKAIQDSIDRGNAPDDLKSAAGEIFVAMRKELKLTRCGNDTASFMRDTLAPLMTTQMSCFTELKELLDSFLRPVVPADSMSKK